MIKAVIFDLDGTLLDRDSSLKLFVQDQYKRYSKELAHIPKQEYISRFIELDHKGYVWKDKVYQQLLAEYDLSNLTWERNARRLSSLFSSSLRSVFTYGGCTKRAKEKRAVTRHDHKRFYGLSVDEY